MTVVLERLEATHGTAVPGRGCTARFCRKRPILVVAADGIDSPSRLKLASARLRRLPYGRPALSVAGAPRVSAGSGLELVPAPRTVRLVCRWRGDHFSQNWSGVHRPSACGLWRALIRGFLDQLADSP